MIQATYWEVRGKKFYFPAETFEQSRDKSLGVHRRIYRNGARVDVVSANEREFKATIPFYDTCEDPHVQGQGRLYTDLLPDFLASWEINEVGNLMTTRGLVRAAAKSYRLVEKEGEFNPPRDETADPEPTALVEAVWIEHNEDDANKGSFQKSGLGRNGKASIERIRGSFTSAGWDGDFMQSLQEYADVLANPIPEYMVGEKLASVSVGVGAALKNALVNFADNFTTPNDAAPTSRENWARPRCDQHDTVRKTHLLRDQVARYQADAERTRPAATERVYTRPVTIWDVAVDSGSTVEDLTAGNPGIDPFNIPPGTKLRTFPRHQ